MCALDFIFVSGSCLKFKFGLNSNGFAFFGKTFEKGNEFLFP
jgi:hypothetical protein